MLNLGIIFTVVLISLVTSQHGSPLQNRDFEVILELLKGAKDQDVKKQEVTTSDSDSGSDEDSTNNSVYGLLKNMEVIDLIQKANQDKVTPKPPNRKERKSHIHSNSPVYRNYEVNRHKDLQILKKLLQNKRVVHLNKQKHHNLTPNNLLTRITLEADGRQDQTNIDGPEYSKILVILDPLAVEKSKNKDALTNLVSRIHSLAFSSNDRDRQERIKSQRYKGFSVKNNLLSRRYRKNYRDGRDSDEDEFKPKRPRKDYGGGGGGGGGTGGRTAIPYMGQRGDIYERDH